MELKTMVAIVAVIVACAGVGVGYLLTRSPGPSIETVTLSVSVMDPGNLKAGQRYTADVSGDAGSDSGDVSPYSSVNFYLSAQEPGDGCSTASIEVVLHDPPTSSGREVVGDQHTSVVICRGVPHTEVAVQFT